MSSSSKTKGRASQRPPTPRRGDLTGLALITVGAVLLAGLQGDGAGPALRWLVELLGLALGRLVAVVPYLLFAVGAVWLLRGQRPAAPASATGLGLTALAVAGLLHLRVPQGEEFLRAADATSWLHPPGQYGGLAGAALVWSLRALVGPVGGQVVLIMLLLAGLAICSERPLGELLLDLRRRLAASGERRPVRPAPRPRRTRPVAPLDLPPPLYLRDEPPTPAAPAAAPAATPAPEPEPKPEVTPAKPEPPVWRPSEKLLRSPVLAPAAGDPKQLVLPGMPQPQLSAAEKAWLADGDPETYHLPPMDLVRPAKLTPRPDMSTEILANSERLETTLASFRIEARVVNTEVGPTVTRYELELAPGIRVSKVAALADDIALALASTGIRIEAPVPGKGVVGIEVPNQNREVVHLHPILASREFAGAPGPLPFVVGTDIAGGIKIAELTRMPHVLVAGSTNSGKSVCLNCIIISLLYRLSPRDLRFLMIDPKRVELTLYDGIPHLDRPVVTDPEDAADLLRGAVREMMARYDRLQDLGVRNIASYNQQVDEEDRMPYIVIIIDELAELMMLARAEVEASICRLAQLARATGIHLVVATQRPSVNVVTGSIKANINTRIAFAVAQQVDSRVILDHVGAERLIGRGDMLYSSTDAGKPERMQGAFVDEQQVHQLVEYLQAMPKTLKVRYGDSIIKPVSAEDEVGEAEEVDDSDLDELFWDCVDFVRREGEASTSRLQRNFGIGYNRAGRITDQMHRLGIIGPPRGSKPREILAGGPTGPGEPRPTDLFDELTRGGE